MSVDKVISAVLHPIKWFATQRIEQLASTLAVRRAIFREIVRLRVAQYLETGGRGSRLDADRARGVQEKVIDRLQRSFDWEKVNPEDEDVRAAIDKAITMAVVPASVWVALRELRRTEPFDPKEWVTVEYRDRSGATHHSTTLIASIQDDFLFFKPFLFLGPSDLAGPPLVSARLPPSISGMLDERLKDEGVELLRFGVSAEPPNPQDMFGQAVEPIPIPDLPPQRHPRSGLVREIAREPSR